jgi:isopenicillin N synthase-like dioxygenase
MLMTIPQIDIAPFLSGDQTCRREIAKQWGSAFETIGFATIVGHSVPEALIEDLHFEAQRFFDQPLEAKQRCIQPGDTDTQGYAGLGTEGLARTLDADALPTPDYCEKITFNYIDWEHTGPSNELDKQIFRPNLWPTEPPRLHSLVETYFDHVHALAHTLMRIGALALDLPEDFFVPYYARMTTQLALVDYPDQKPAPLPGQVRSGAHVDYLGFTILRQDDAPGGLQVRLPDGGWIDVAPVPRAFVINAGELLARWTNGRWKSNVHRVVNPPRNLSQSARRLSIALFTGPNHDSMIECLPTCQSEEVPPQYRSVRAWDHFVEKVRASKVTGGY